MLIKPLWSHGATIILLNPNINLKTVVQKHPLIVLCQWKYCMKLMKYKRSLKFNCSNALLIYALFFEFFFFEFENNFVFSASTRLIDCSSEVRTGMPWSTSF